jgi:hypothetical protein
MCEKECGKCSVKCNGQSSEDNTTGKCKCNVGWIDPYCLEECSGACRYPGDLDDNGNTIPTPEDNQVCDSTSRCSCFFGCLEANYLDASVLLVDGQGLPDAGMPFDECACHCANSDKTGEMCD